MQSLIAVNVEKVFLPAFVLTGSVVLCPSNKNRFHQNEAGGIYFDHLN